MSQSSDLVKVMWSTIWIWVVSEIWNHRNFIVFKTGVTNVSAVFAIMQVKNLVFASFPILIGVWNL